MTQEQIAELTPEQKATLEKEVAEFCSNKVNTDGDWWYNTRNFKSSISLDIIFGMAFEPFFKDGKVYVGSEWKLKTVTNVVKLPVKKSKKSKK